MAIIFRAVREQLEHDRIIRLLQEKYKRHFDVEVNIGDDRSSTYKLGTATYYPDLILTSRQAPRRVVAVFEIETAESVNHLEAMAQWANFSKGKAAFHLYVPDAKLEITRHLCGEHQVKIGQLWSYLPLGEGDEFRFTKVEEREPLVLPAEPRAEAPPKKAGKPPAVPAAAAPKAPKAPKAARPPKPAKPVKAAPAKKAAKPARAAKPVPAAKKPTKAGAKKASGTSRPVARPAKHAPPKKAGAKPAAKKAAAKKVAPKKGSKKR